MEAWHEAMSIVLPILFFALAIGLVVKKVTPRVWFVLICWICLVIAFNLVRG